MKTHNISFLNLFWMLSIVFIGGISLVGVYGSAQTAPTESIRVIRENCSGYSNCYTSLSAWQTAERRDIVSSNEIAVARIEGTWTNPDAIPVDIGAGWTTDSANYIRVYTTGTARHSGVWDDSAYRLSVSNTDWRGAAALSTGYIRIDGLQIENRAAKDSGNVQGIAVGRNNAQGEFHITNNIFRSSGSGVGNVDDAAINLDPIGGGRSSIIKIANNIIYGWGSGINWYWSGGILDGAIYNNTIVNSDARGMRLVESTAYNNMHVKNNLIQGSSVNYDLFNVESFGGNLSSDATSPDTSLRSRAVGFQSGSNFHLSSSDTLARDLGVNLSGDQIFAFSNDIDGETRSGSWDIGADEGSSQSQTPIPTVTFSAGAASVTQGQSTALSWSSTNTTSCTASGGWSGTKSISGSQVVTPTNTTTYTLSCSGAGGTTAQSVTVTVTSAPDATAPTTPTGFSATVISSSQINLTWSASTDNVGVTGYRIYRNGALLTTTTNTSYSNTGLSANTTYNYSVGAYDAAGNNSVQTGTVSATTQQAAPVSTRFTLNQRIQTTDTLNIRSSANGTVLDTQVQSASGVVVGGPMSAGGYVWWDINFDSGVDGWGAEDWLTEYVTPETSNTSSTGNTANTGGNTSSTTSGGSSSTTGGGSSSSSTTTGGSTSTTQPASNTTTGGGGAYTPTNTATTGSGATQTTENIPIQIQTTYTFTRNLSLGSEGEDVRQLQIFLNNNGYPVASTGAGSSGNETTYFGPATESALQKFQSARNIVSSGSSTTTGYGAFGPRTRATINALPGTALPQTEEELVAQLKQTIEELQKQLIVLLTQLAEQLAKEAEVRGGN